MKKRFQYRSFRRRYKYKLTGDFSIKTIYLSGSVNLPYIQFDPNGLLTIRKGYAWDGASGPTIDSKCTMRGSLVHDVLYQLLREKHIGGKTQKIHEQIRCLSDKLLIQLCREDGMWWIRGFCWYYALRWFGAKNARS